MIEYFYYTMRKKYLSSEEIEQVCERNLTGLPCLGKLRKHELAWRLTKTGYVKDTYRIHRDSQLITVKDKVHRIVEKF